MAFLGIEQGVGLAMLLSLADRTRRSARPQDAILGRLPGTVQWIPTDVGRDTEQVAGVIVYLLYAQLWVCQIVDSADQPVRAFVLDADGIPDIDYTGARALGELATELKQRGMTTTLTPRDS